MSGGGAARRPTVPRRGGATVDVGAGVVEVRLQEWPGVDGAPVRGLRARLGDRDLPTVDHTFRVTTARRPVQVDVLDDGGRALFSLGITGRRGLPPLVAPSRDDWTAAARGDDDAAAERVRAALHAALVRLNHLGYGAGVEAREPGEFAGPSAALERALLTFEADHGLLPEGLTSRFDNRGRAGVFERVHPRTLERLREVSDRDVGGAPPEDAQVARGGVGRDPDHVRLPEVAAFRRLRLTLVRFERDEPASPTVTEDYGEGRESLPDWTHPYVDDSGYAHTRGHAEGHHGPLVAVCQQPGEVTYSVRLVRENLPDDVPLHVESCLPLGVHVDAGPLPAGSSAPVRFRVSPDVCGDRDERLIDLLVRLGSASGPQVHVLRVVVLRPLPVRVAVTAIRFRGQAQYPVTTRRAALLTLARCDRLLRQAGLSLELTHFHQVDSQDDFGWSSAFERMTPARQADAREASSEAFCRVRHHPDCLNVVVGADLAYFHGSRTLAVGRVADAPGGLTDVLCQPDAFDARSEHVPHVLAHEVGHALGLLHTDRDDPSSDDDWFRVTSWAMRRLMFFRTHGPSRFPDWHPTPKVTSGRGEVLSVSHMLTLRDLPGDALDNEVARLRQRVRSGQVYDGVSCGLE